jgi:hypothetical protein
MDTYARCFGADAPAVPLASLAAALAEEAGEAPAVVEHVLRWVGVVSNGRGAPAGVPEIAAATHIARVDYLNFLARFGGAGDHAAVRQAKTLFTGNTLDGSLALPAWYHGLTLPSAEAGRVAITGRPAGTFLVRLSATQANALAVTYVMGAGEVRHTRLQHQPTGYVVEGTATVYPTLASLVQAYPSMWAMPLPSALSSASLLVPAAPPARIAPPAVAAVAGGAGAMAAPPPAAAAETFDAMISYKWDNQVLVRRIKEALVGAGFRIWMDESNMSATYVKDMVNAVARSKCVIMCTSNGYCKSRNCTTEANVVYEHNKPYIVLNMEAGFYPGRAEGVVGALAAGRLYIDFSADDKFDAGLTMILKQLADNGVTPSGPVAPPPAPLGSVASVKSVHSVGSVGGGSGATAGAAATATAAAAAPFIAAPGLALGGAGGAGMGMGVGVGMAFGAPPLAAVPMGGDGYAVPALAHPAAALAAPVGGAFVAGPGLVLGGGGGPVAGMYAPLPGGAAGGGTFVAGAGLTGLGAGGGAAGSAYDGGF